MKRANIIKALKIETTEKDTIQLEREEDLMKINRLIFYNSILLELGGFLYLIQPDVIFFAKREVKNEKTKNKNR